MLFVFYLSIPKKRAMGRQNARALLYSDISHYDADHDNVTLVNLVLQSSTELVYVYACVCVCVCARVRGFVRAAQKQKKGEKKRRTS